MPKIYREDRVRRSASLFPRLKIVRQMVVASVRGFLHHGGFTTSAALAFYFLLSLLPFLIFLASALAHLPIQHLTERMINLVSHFVPEQTMPLVRTMLTSTMRSDEGLLSMGFIFAVVAASNAFAFLSDVLNKIYEGKETQSFWRSRLAAIGVTVIVGGMAFVALSAVLLGPRFADELARVFDISHTFVRVWPVLRWLLVVGCVLASIEVLYYVGPNRPHSLRQQLPGSVFAVAVWIGSTEILGIYFRKLAYLNVMYGTVVSFIVFMTWLQITAAAVLLGAELNVQLEQAERSVVVAAETHSTRP
jgi:membrane protein